MILLLAIKPGFYYGIFKWRNHKIKIEFALVERLLLAPLFYE